MLSGRAKPESLAAGAPTIARFDAPPVVLHDVEVVQVLYEIKTDPVTDMLPPGLHPTLPGIVSWLAYACGDSPWGAFRLVQTRIECRSGNRPRALLVSGVCDNEAVRAALATGFGFRLQAGGIDLRRGYDGADLRVREADREILSLELRDPTLLPAGVVQFVSGMHPAHTPNGFRLAQVDVDHETTRSERARPRLRSFDAGAWGDLRIEPLYPVAGAICLAEVTVQALRFVCKPEVISFMGTEKVGG
jgi:hypothetical protein